MTGRTLDFRFVREPGLVSWLIDRGTGGFLRYRGPRWSHVGLILAGAEIVGLNPRARLVSTQTYEFGARSGVDRAVAGRPGVQFRPYDYARFLDSAIVAVPVTNREWLAFWGLARKIEGAAYSETTIEGFLTGDNVPEHARELAFDCSTLSAWLCLHGLSTALPPAFRGELRQISPNAFYYLARMIAWQRRELVAGA
jgi:hypothetical protein